MQAGSPSGTKDTLRAAFQRACWPISGIAGGRRADPFRLAFTVALKGGKGAITEARIGYQGLVHHEWEETEPNAVIAFVSLSATRSRAQITVKVEHSFSLHSLARFYERTGCRDDSEVISAMVSALVIEPKAHAIGADVSSGNWRGDIRFRAVGEDQVTLWCARTWF